MVTYCDPSDVRRITGLTGSTPTDQDIMEFIIDADAWIDLRISVTSPPQRLIKRLSALLASIDIFSKPGTGGGFKLGDLSVSTSVNKDSKKDWEKEAEKIYRQYETYWPIYVKNEPISE